VKKIIAAILCVLLHRGVVADSPVPKEEKCLWIIALPREKGGDRGGIVLAQAQPSLLMSIEPVSLVDSFPQEEKHTMLRLKQMNYTVLVRLRCKLWRSPLNNNLLAEQVSIDRVYAIQSSLPLKARYDFLQKSALALEGIEERADEKKERSETAGED
jgi:hypothetical protein